MPFGAALRLNLPIDKRMTLVAAIINLKCVKSDPSSLKILFYCLSGASTTNHFMAVNYSLA